MKPSNRVMKSSNYNYIIPYKGKFIFFNGITRRFFDVSAENLHRFERVLNNPDDAYEGDVIAPFLRTMKDNGFLIENDEDEQKLIKKLLHLKSTPDQYMLMILPTYQCNLRCWYCIQEHQTVNLSDEMIQRIKKHIVKYLSVNKVRNFRLSWFGGEPLLAYSQVLDLTSFSSCYCEKNGIGFYCDVTTNSLLLTDNRIEELHHAGVCAYQITIDGCRKKHILVKQSTKENTFDRALHNVLQIVKTNPKVHCTLRINYKEDTLDPTDIMNDVNALIPPKYRPYIEIFPRKIWQVPEFEGETEKVSSLNSCARENTYRVECSGRGLCYVDGVHFNCIFPNGRVDKCENERLEDTRGALKEDGTIEWDERNPFESHSAISAGSECSTCRHLPFCMGPCPQRRNEMLAKGHHISCQFVDRDRTMENLIVTYCENNRPLHNQTVIYPFLSQ